MIFGERFSDEMTVVHLLRNQLCNNNTGFNGLYGKSSRTKPAVHASATNGARYALNFVGVIHVDSRKRTKRREVVDNDHWRRSGGVQEYDERMRCKRGREKCVRN